MSTDWTAIFFDTLTKYVLKYIEARGNLAARARILKKCGDVITNSPLHEKQDIELPDNLCYAIRGEFLSYVEDDEHEEEKTKLEQLQNTGEYQTAEEREMAARSVYAGDYWTLFDGFSAAQRLFADEVALIDEGCRDKKNKKTFGDRTIALRKWYDKLPKSKLKEAEMAAIKWNSEGAPDKDRMHIYRKKNLRKRTDEFIEAVRRSMGVECVVLAGYEVPKSFMKDKSASGLRTVYLEADIGPEKKGFTRSSDDRIAWATQGAELFGDYMAGEDEDSENNPSDKEEDDVPEILVDVAGHPILPTCRAADLKSQQAVVRDIFTKAYMRVTRRKKVHVPWLQLGREPESYLDLDTLPEGFNVVDPSKLTKRALGDLWDHWSDRARIRQPILIFTSARKQDIGLSGSGFDGKMPKWKQMSWRKRILMSSDDESDEEDNKSNKSDDQDDESGNQAKADKDKAVGPSVRLPPSKRPRLWHDDQASDDESERRPASKHTHLSKQTAIPDEHSPAENNGIRMEFLGSLSKETSYIALLDGVSALPAIASSESSSSAPKSKPSLPVWASWDWGQKYLPMDIHADRQKIGKELDLLDRYTFADREAGTLIVLALGLLLREYWRAVEVEEDDDSAPEFLRNSYLDKTRVKERIIKAIEEAIGRLPSPDADKERQKEKELGGSAKGQKARASQKKGKKIPTHTRTPPPEASTSNKPFGAENEVVSPAQNIRSQRVRKPSKKLRDSN